jgi:hypothetical protein
MSCPVMFSSVGSGPYGMASWHAFSTGRSN